MMMMAKGKRHGRARGGDSPHRLSHGEQTVSQRRVGFYWALAVGLSAVLVYLNALGNDFVLDDIRLVRDNVSIRSLANVPDLFVSSYWGGTTAQALYRPLVLATYAVNYAINGLSAQGYTAVNIVLHTAVSLLLLALVRGLGGSWIAAGVTGIAFAVHPVHTEAVTAISGRPELLAAFFFLLAMHLHRQALGAGRASLWFRMGMLGCFAAALLSKESAITLVLVLPVMDNLIPAQGRDDQLGKPRSRILTDYLPVLGVALVYLAVRQVVLGGILIDDSAIAPLDNPTVPVATMPLGDIKGATAGQAMMTRFAVIVEYARLLVWPARLSPDYSYNHLGLVSSPLDGRFIAGVALVAACISAVVVLWRRSPIAAFGLAFFALTFSLVSNFVITIGTICAERLLYLPSAGALVAAGLGAERLAGTAAARRRLAFGLLTVLLLIGTARTCLRNREWQNEFTLWSAAVEVAPGSARVQSEYGRILLQLAEVDAGAGRTAEAERLYASARAHFETALRIYPSYSLPIDGLAMIDSVHNRFESADVLYSRAMKAWPGNYASLTNWGLLQWERSRRVGTRAASLREAGKIAEADGLLREADGGFREALEKVNQAISMMPTYVHAHLIRAMMLENYVGDSDGAIAELETVLRLMPNHPQRAVIDSELQRLQREKTSRTLAPARGAPPRRGPGD
jgi:protein O-mannosyl-transferase